MKPRLSLNTLLKPSTIKCAECGGELHVIPFKRFVSPGKLTIETINLCAKCNFRGNQTMKKLISKIVKIEYHRNGVSGEGFHIVNFKMRQDREYERVMIAIVFHTPHHIAVFDFDKLKEGNFDWLANSWRGDDFEPELREAIRLYEER